MRKILNPIFADKKLMELAKELGFIKKNQLKTENGIFRKVPFRIKTSSEILDELQIADDETGVNATVDYYDMLYDKIVQEGNDLSYIAYNAIIKSDNYDFDENDFYKVFNSTDEEGYYNADTSEWEVDLEYTLRDFFYRLWKIEYEWKEDCDNEIRDMTRYQNELELSDVNLDWLGYIEYNGIEFDIVLGGGLDDFEIWPRLDKIHNADDYFEECDKLLDEFGVEIWRGIVHGDIELLKN